MRKRKGWTLGQMSDRTGIQITSLSMIETGQRTNISVDTAARIAAALGVKVDDLCIKDGGNGKAKDCRARKVHAPAVRHVRRAGRSSVSAIGEH